MKITNIKKPLIDFENLTEEEQWAYHHLMESGMMTKYDTANRVWMCYTKKRLSMRDFCLKHNYEIPKNPGLEVNEDE